MSINHIFRNRVILLEQIKECGSVLLIAKKFGQATRSVNDAIDVINNLCLEPAIEHTNTLHVELSEYGHDLLQRCKDSALNSFEKIALGVGGYSLKLSARNKLLGTIKDIEIDDLTLRLKVDIKGVEFEAEIIQRSFDYMSLKHHDKVVLVIKANKVELFEQKPDKKGANLFKAVVEEVMYGEKNKEIITKLENGIRLNSFVDASFEFKVGQNLYVWFDSNNIIVGA